MSYYNDSYEFEDYDDDDCNGSAIKELIIKFEGATNSVKVQSTNVGLKVCA